MLFRSGTLTDEQFHNYLADREQELTMEREAANQNSVVLDGTDFGIPVLENEETWAQRVIDEAENLKKKLASWLQKMKPNKNY